MAAENQSKSTSSSTTTNTNTNKSNKRKQRYLPNNKPVKKKGAYPLRPGVQGFFITCDGGRERQASHEAINVIDSFYEELVHGKDTGMMPAGLPSNPLNKKITFSYSDDDDDEDEEEEEEEKDEEKKEEKKDEEKKEEEKNEEKKEEKKDEEKKEEEKDEEKKEEANKSDQTEEKSDDGQEDGKNNENQANKAEDGKNNENQAHKADEPPAKKQCIETHASKCVINDKVEEKSIDKLIEAELNELGDKNKRRFINLDSGCNGVVFVQMRKRDGDPGPKDIAQHMMTSAASTRKHMSRFILRVLPVEVACYASEEEISRAIKPLVEQYFPETQNPQKEHTGAAHLDMHTFIPGTYWRSSLDRSKFAVLYEARANTGIDRMKIINSVAKSVPGPHKVDLSNPDKTIVVEIVKTVCLIGVVEKYKELAKFNLRQLTSPK